MYSIAIALHAIAATVWVGGMFFMLVVARPSIMTLDPTARTPLMALILKKFFPWVWMAIIFLLVTGYLLVGAMGGFASSPAYVHIMHLVGWVMVGLFTFLYFKPNKAFRRAVESGNPEVAAKSLNQVRLIVTVNLVLGLLLIAVVTGGRYI